MALNAKPFDPLQRIIRAIYKGKPNVFADVDVNRHMEVLRASADILWGSTTLRTGSNVGLGIFTFTGNYNSGASNTLTYNLAWTSFSVICRGMEFSVGAGSLSGTTVATNYPALRLYLIAEKANITFDDDPIMSGVNGSGLASPIASADHEIYINQRLAFGVYPGLPTLNTGEEIIAAIGTIIPMVGVPKFYMLTNSAYAEKVKVLLGNKFGNDISLVEANQYVMDYFLNYVAEPIGTWKGFHGNLTNKFDNTGLGINNFTGWALCNGANGTPDFRGRVPLMFDERLDDPLNDIWDISYTAIGNVIGQKQVTLTESQMPSHYHLGFAADAGGNDPIDGNSSVSGANLDGGNAGYILTKGTGIPNAGRTGTAGGGNPHENRQPSIVTGFIIRIS